MNACLSLDYLDDPELELDELPGYIVAEAEAESDPTVQARTPEQWLAEACQESESDRAVALGDTFWDAHSEAMLRESCALFAAEILTGPFEEPYDGHFLIAEHHDEWDDLVLEHRRLCVLAPRDHGKCMRGDALILTPSGARVRIDEWPGGLVWAYDEKACEFVQANASPAVSNGYKNVLRVRTRTGREVVVTENHPLRLFDRWERADRIQVGDRIAVPLNVPTVSKRLVPDAWLLGLLIGDGGFTGSNCVLTNSDPEIISAASRYGYELSQDRNNPLTYRVLGYQKRLRQLGLMGEDSHSKRVPKEIHSASVDSIAAFLAGYFDADGTVNIHGGGSAEFYSVSEFLLRDVQSLLIRLGVISVLSPKLGRYQGGPHYSWRLTLRGSALELLAESLSLQSQKKNTLQALVNSRKAQAVCSGPCIDLFPTAAYAGLEHSEDWFRKQGLPRPSRQYEPTRGKLLRVARAEGNDALAAQAQAPVLWDAVVDVESLGVEETWAICVPGHENYLANDILNHNSFFFDFAYPIWQAWRHPGKAGFIFSATKEQAVRILADIKAEFESNPRLSHLVPGPGSKRRWSSTLIELNNGHKIYARGYGTKVRGAHPMWIVVDDGLNDETIYSDLVRTKQIEYFHTAISNMCTTDGQIVVVGTAFHSADLYADLADNQEYHFERYQALSPCGKPLWPARYSLETLLRKKREIGEIRFAREFQCDPVSDDMSLFPLYLFQGETVEQPTLTLGMPLEFWQEVGVTLYIGVDFAMSSSVQADYTVIWVMGLDQHGNRWLVDIYREKGLPYQAQLSKINEMGRKYDPALVFLEANQMQRIFGDELIRTTDLPIKKFTTGAAKNTLDKGVPSLRVLLENGKFRIPRGDRRSVDLTNEWIKEMRAFTFQEGKLQSVGTHDDTVMACWICDQAIRAGGFSFDFGQDVDLSPESVKQLLKEVMSEGSEDGGGNAASTPGSAGDGGPSNGGASKPPAANLIDEDPDPFQVGGGNPRVVLGAPRAMSLMGY
jgi:intein/homing endonuclease